MLKPGFVYLKNSGEFEPTFISWKKHTELLWEFRMAMFYLSHDPKQGKENAGELLNLPTSLLTPSFLGVRGETKCRYNEDENDHTSEL